jgi:hypothetical protein
MTGRSPAVILGGKPSKGISMSDRENEDAAADHRQFLELLEQSGFFRQISALEESLKSVAGELKTFGEHAVRRMDETENLAAHVLAIESILAVMLKSYPVLKDDLDAEVRDRTAAIAGNPEGSRTVRALAQDILDKATG